MFKVLATKVSLMNRAAVREDLSLLEKQANSLLLRKALLNPLWVQSD